jgi:hypothetical protein
VVIEVSNGVAEETLCLSGTGSPYVLIIDHDLLKDEPEATLRPHIPPRIVDAYTVTHGRHPLADYPPLPPDSP